MSRSFFMIAALLVAGPVAPAQHEMHEATDRIGWVPREILERPVLLRSGIGTVHDPVTTSVMEAQAFYNQGVAYLHSYVWIEAARSFNQALRSDPKLALAYVGLSRAYSGLEDQQMAMAAVRKAQDLSGYISEREKRRIAIRAVQMDAILDISNTTKHETYKKAIDAALTIDINDVELWLLRGNAEEPTAAGRGQRGLLAAVAFYEAALRRDPENFAAYHYLIHTYEGLNRVEDAVRAGEKYASLVPQVPHAQHMYGHDLRIVGRVEESVAQFRKADVLERAYYTNERIDPKYDWHHVHNLDLMSTSFEYRGEIRQAEAIWREAYTLPAVDAYWEAYRSKWPELLLRNGQHQEALEACEDLVGSRWALGRSIGHALRGQVLVAQGKDQEARRELEQAEVERAQVEEYDSEPLMPQPRLLAAEPVESLKAQLEMQAEEARSAGREHLRKVLTQLSQVSHTADALVVLFRIEYLSGFAAKKGDAELADFAARLALKFDSNHAGGHYALAIAAERSHDPETARREFANAARLWSTADSAYAPARIAREHVIQ